MFGYVKTEPRELKGKYNDLYKAFYCGLCRSMKKNVSSFFTFALNYDFVFLAIVRMAATREKACFGLKRCSAHPSKKRPYVQDCESLRYTVKVSLIYTYRKLDDDINDKDKNFFKRLIYRFSRRLLKGKLKKARDDSGFAALESALSEPFESLEKLENEGSDNLDSVCACSGRALSVAASFGLNGECERILSYIGDMLGRFIYTIDAADDIEQDEKSGSYNTLLKLYGSSYEAMKHFEEIDMTASQYIARMKDSAALLNCDEGLSAIIENIFNFGLGNQAKRVFKDKKLNNRKISADKGAI